MVLRREIRREPQVAAGLTSNAVAHFSERLCEISSRKVAR